MRGWLVLLLLVPGAHALEMTGTDAPATLAPDAAWRWDLAIVVHCDDILQSAGGEATIELNVTTGHEAIVAVGPERHAFDRSRCIGQPSVEVRVAYDIIVGMDVPAEEPFMIVARASMEGQEDAEARTRIVPELVFLYNATAPVVHKMAAPQKEIAYPIEITSHSNGLNVFRFVLEDLVGEGNVVLPTPHILRGRGPGEHQVVEVIYMTPFRNGNNHETAEFTIAVVPESTKDPANKGESRVLTFTADTKGVYVPGSPLAVLAVGVLALARWRR